ncbi:MAG: hypothetical protein RLZZ67_413 [Candidatus Parcubacteria bacterium]|jgi:hypothetical protein
MKSIPNRTKKRGFSGWLIAALFVIACVLASGYLVHKKSVRQKKEQAVKDYQDFTVIEVRRSRAVDGWWMRSNPSASLEMHNLLQQKANYVMGLLRKHKDISPETRRIVERFSDIRAGAFVNNGYRFMNVNDVPTAPTGKAIGLCFIPEDVASKHLQYSPMWHVEANTISLPAFTVPEKLLVAVMFHELGHSIRHNNEDGRFKDGEKEMLAEEVAMHEFAGFILNHLTEGAYYTLLQKIIDRNKTESRFDVVITSITPEEKSLLYRMFDCENTEAPRAMLANNVILTIGFKLCEMRGKGIEGKVLVYQWLGLDLSPLTL